MSNQTYTENEIREAFYRAMEGGGIANDVIRELTRPKLPVIPEGVLCWGNIGGETWYPALSEGDGNAEGYVPYESRKVYSTIRLTRPEDWAKAPEWANSRATNELGESVWVWPSPQRALELGYIYAEGRPNE
jgi:hypothetical protein